ncbi:YwqG family protein [Corynebacterium sp. H130]|uniref:YwqG family protein n=1 Tax=Corynebacterium sp. H130 TaxID=3133444 RepID=UPI0030A4DEB7
MLLEFPRIPYTASETPAGLTDSKLGGAPYRPVGTTWPTEDSGQVLNFVAQLNLAHVESDRQALALPPLFEGVLPTEGILQFFLPFWEVYDSGPGIAHIEYFPTCDEPAQPPRIAWQPWEEDPLIWLTETATPVEDHRALSSMLDFPCFPYKLTPKEAQPLIQVFDDIDDDESSSQVGGVGTFVDSTPTSPVLFYLDSICEPVTIGDCGVMGFFIQQEALVKRDFRNVNLEVSLS